MQTKFLTKLMLPLTAATIISATGCFSTNDRMAGRVMDDRKITGRVKSALSHDPVYKYSDVEVNTHDGNVQLTGWANLAEQRDKATEIARQVPGVIDLTNNILIKRTPTGHPVGYPYYTPGKTNDVQNWDRDHQDRDRDRDRQDRDQTAPSPPPPPPSK